MNRLAQLGKWLPAAALIALASSAGPALAQPMRAPSMDATYICRQAAANETATARMVASQTTLVCRPVAVSMRMDDGSMKLIGDVRARPMPGPDFSKALTPEQMQQVCERWLEALFHISHTS